MKRIPPLLIAGLCLTLSATLFARSPKPGQTDAPVGMKPDRLIPYKSVDGVELKLHAFEPEGLKASDHRPAIVFFFGGGWTGGDAKQFYQQARALSDLGMVAFSADYPYETPHIDGLAKKGGHVLAGLLSGACLRAIASGHHHGP